MTGTNLRAGGRLPALALTFGLLLLTAACDTADLEPFGQVTVQGTVSESLDYSSEPEGVSDAEVSAYAFNADGSLQALGSTVTTDAQGRYTLTVQGTDRPVRIQATAAGETEAGYATTIEAGGARGGTVRAAPMTSESRAQAHVHAQAIVNSPQFSVADALALVSGHTAASIDGGATTLEHVAASARSALDAETAWMAHAQGGNLGASAAEQARLARIDAYADFRTAIHAAANENQRREAVEAFYLDYNRAYAGAGASELQQAHAASVAARASQRFVGTADATGRFSTTLRANLRAALAAAHAVEEEFRASGASQTRLNALAQARTDYMAARGAATSAQHVIEANVAYRNAVRAELAAESGLSTAQIDAAFAATLAARAALDTAVQGAAHAQAVADAHATFFPAAVEAAQASLGMEQSFGANIVGTLAAF
jgi:hypothetical protein